MSKYDQIDQTILAEVKKKTHIKKVARLCGKKYGYSSLSFVYKSLKRLGISPAYQDKTNFTIRDEFIYTMRMQGHTVEEISKACKAKFNWGGRGSIFRRMVAMGLDNVRMRSKRPKPITPVASIPVTPEPIVEPAEPITSETVVSVTPKPAVTKPAVTKPITPTPVVPIKRVPKEKYLPPVLDDLGDFPARKQCMFLDKDANARVFKSPFACKGVRYNGSLYCEKHLAMVYQSR